MSQSLNKIIDSHGRAHTYLRISLTERCNLRCQYCMPEEGVELRDRSQFMSSEEVIEMAKTFVKLGVTKIRLTGGEPLIKKDIRNVLLQLSKLPVELSLTTNAVIVDRHIETLKEAGIKSLNVSLDTLDKAKFKEITRRDQFDKVMSNIDLLIKEGFKVKVNAVLMKDFNESEIIDFIDWTKNKNIAFRFIEFMPFDGNEWNWDKTVSYKAILDKIENHFGTENLEKVTDQLNDTSRNFRIKNYLGTFGIISSVTNPFCDSCNRIRLTADGKIKNCLFSYDEIDLLTAMRNGEDIVPNIFESISAKKALRSGIDDFEFFENKKDFNRSMITIGG